MTAKRHPAKFSDPILKVIARLLAGSILILDPFAGVGRLAEVAVPGQQFYLNDLEGEWVWQAAGLPGVCGITIGDARYLPYPDGFFDAVATSCTYGNRLADRYLDHTQRITYTAYLGRQLSDGNTGGMPWGKRYRETHIACWKEAWRVIAAGGKLILNVSDHLKTVKGEQITVPVTAWHIETLEAIGFVLEERIDVPTKRHRQGKNHAARVPSEHVLVFRKAA